MEEEIWKPAVYSRFPELIKDMEVSNLGNIRKISNKKLYSDKNHKDGYPCIKKGNKTLYFHTFVAETFLGTRPDNMVIDHIDNDKYNKKLSNLRYVTIQHNSVKQDRQETTENGELVFRPCRHWKENFIRSADRMKKDIEELKNQNKLLTDKLNEVMQVVFNYQSL